MAVILLALLASACGARQSSNDSVQQVWTSPAEPSPPGSGNRWSRADERQLLRSYER